MRGGKETASLSQQLDDVAPSPDPRERLSALMKAHGDGVYTYCLRIVNDSALASDLLQQVFEQAYRDLETLRDERQARPWLFSIAHHRALDALKAERRRAAHVSDEPEALELTESEEPMLSERVEATELSVALAQCVRALGVHARTAVLLRFKEGMSYEQMTGVCGEKWETLRGRVTRSLPVLRRCLEGKGVL